MGRRRQYIESDLETINTENATRWTGSDALSDISENGSYLEHDFERPQPQASGNRAIEYKFPTHKNISYSKGQQSSERLVENVRNSRDLLREAESKVRHLTREVGHLREELGNERKRLDKAVNKARQLESENAEAKRDLAELRFSNKQLASEGRALKEAQKAASEKNKDALMSLKAGLHQVEQEVSQRAVDGFSLLQSAFAHIQSLQAVVLEEGWASSTALTSSTLNLPTTSRNPALASEVRRLFSDTLHTLSALSSVISGPSSLLSGTQSAGLPQTTTDLMTRRSDQRLRLGADWSESVELQRANERAQKLGERIESMQGELSASYDHIRESAEATTLLTRHLTMVEAERDSLAAEVASLGARLTEEQNCSLERAQIVAQSEESSALIPEYRAMVLKAKAACTGMRERMAQAQDQQANLANQVESLQTEIRLRDSDIAELRKQEESIQRRLVEEQERATSQKEDLLRQCEKQVDTLIRQAEERDALVEQLREDKILSAQAAERSHQANRNLEAQVAQLTSQAAALQANNAHLQAVSHTLEDQSAEHRAALAELQNTQQDHRHDIRTALDVLISRRPKSEQEDGPSTTQKTQQEPPVANPQRYSFLPPHLKSMVQQALETEDYTGPNSTGLDTQGTKIVNPVGTSDAGAVPINVRAQPLTQVPLSVNQSTNGTHDLDIERILANVDSLTGHRGSFTAGTGVSVASVPQPRVPVNTSFLPTVPEHSGEAFAPTVPYMSNWSAGASALDGATLVHNNREANHVGTCTAPPSSSAVPYMATAPPNPAALPIPAAPPIPTAPPMSQTVVIPSVVQVTPPQVRRNDEALSLQRDMAALDSEIAHLEVVLHAAATQLGSPRG